MNDNGEVRRHVGLKFLQNKLRDRTQEVADLRDFELTEKIVIEQVISWHALHRVLLVIKEADND